MIFFFYISFRDIVKSDQKHFTLGCKIWQTCKIPSWSYFTGFCESPTWAAKVCQPALRGWWFHLWKHLGAVGWQLRHGRAFTPEAKCKEDVMLTQSSPPAPQRRRRRRLDGLAGCHGLTNRLRHDPDHVGVIIFQRYFSFRGFSRMSLENRGKHQMWTARGGRREMTTWRLVDILVFALI